MKKTLLAAMMAAVLVLAGCGAQETSAPAADTAASGEAAEEKAEEVVEEAAEETSEDAEEAAAEESAGESAEDAAAEENADAPENAGNGANAADTFIFEYDGIQMYVNQEAAEVLDALGEPASYFEAASCAFEGLDKMYTYSSFELDTYPEGDTDYISCIYFLDDMVETPEGISLYMTQADMEAAYGTDYEEANGAYVYTKGNGQLSFIIENDEIVVIEYKTKVDYD